MRLLSLLLICCGISSCATTGTLRINQVAQCLQVGKNIAVTNSCLQAIDNYTAGNSIKDPVLGLHTVWVTDVCSDIKAIVCSEPDLIKRLDIGKRAVLNLRKTKKIDDAEIILTPSLIFYSNQQNMGGSLVQLYVFYNQKTKKVVGWVDRGRSHRKFDFRKRM